MILVKSIYPLLHNNFFEVVKRFRNSFTRGTKYSRMDQVKFVKDSL